MKIFLTLLFTSFLSLSSFAETFNYKCFSYYWNGRDDEKGTLLLKVNSKNAEADIVEESWDESIGGERNLNYKSRGAIRWAKFGYNLILEEVLLEGGKELKDGQWGGLARVEGQAEGGFYQYKFICKAD
jgi:hypothetical protein